eukprot:scaffold11899_cov40-Prasinocladus_malaysianus.AAC.3
MKLSRRDDNNVPIEDGMAVWLRSSGTSTAPAGAVQPYEYEYSYLLRRVGAISTNSLPGTVRGSGEKGFRAGIIWREGRQAGKSKKTRNRQTSPSCPYPERSFAIYDCDLMLPSAANILSFQFGTDT